MKIKSLLLLLSVLMVEAIKQKDENIVQGKQSCRATKVCADATLPAVNATEIHECIKPCHLEIIRSLTVNGSWSPLLTVFAGPNKERTKYYECWGKARPYDAAFSELHENFTTRLLIGWLTESPLIAAVMQVDESNSDTMSTLGSSKIYSLIPVSIIATGATVRALTLSYLNEMFERCPNNATESQMCIDDVTRGEFKFDQELPELVFNNICKCKQQESKCAQLGATLDQDRCDWYNQLNEHLVKAGAAECTELPFAATLQSFFCPGGKSLHQQLEHRCNTGKKFTFDEIIDIWTGEHIAKLMTF